MAKEKGGPSEPPSTPALRRLVDSLVAALDKAKAAWIMARREIGKSIVEIEANRNGKYGLNPMRYVRKRFGKRRDTLRPMREFAVRFSDKEAQKLVELRNEETGRGLEWSHIIALTRLDSTADAMDLAQQVVSEGWLVKTLTLEVTRRGGRRSMGGRVPAHAGTLLGELEAIVSTARTWSRRADRWWLSDKDGIPQMYEREKNTMPRQPIATRASAAIESLTALSRRALQLASLLREMTNGKSASR